MSHLIDGHNLIGSRALAGVTLGDPNDEAHLVALLRAFAARPGAPPMTVFFDAGPSGGNVGMGVTPRALGSTRTVEVRFSAPGEQADDAIIGFLERQKQPGQFTVVTDDGELRQRALSIWGERGDGAAFRRADAGSAPDTPETQDPRAARRAGPACAQRG